MLDPDPDPLPVVSAVAPSEGPEAGGTEVTITGENLAGVTSVTFGAAEATFAEVSDAELSATAPPGTGTVAVMVTTAAGSSETNDAAVFTYLVPPDPGGSTATIDVGGQTVTVVGPEGSTVSVASVDLASLPEPPADLELPVGALSIDVVGVSPGSVASVTVTLEEPVDSVLKLLGGVWDPFDPDGTTGASLSADGLAITLLLQDSGRGDIDGVADGKISDPLLPGIGGTWFEPGCYSSGNLDVGDLRYDGSQGTIGNFAILTSFGGFCMGSVAPLLGDAAIVRAADAQAAIAVCENLGDLVSPPGNIGQCHVGVPADAWSCRL